VIEQLGDGAKRFSHSLPSTPWLEIYDLTIGRQLTPLSLLDGTAASRIEAETVTRVSSASVKLTSRLFTRRPFIRVAATNLQDKKSLTKTLVSNFLVSTSAFYPSTPTTVAPDSAIAICVRRQTLLRCNWL